MNAARFMAHVQFRQQAADARHLERVASDAHADYVLAFRSWGGGHPTTVEWRAAYDRAQAAQRRAEDELYEAQQCALDRLGLQPERK